MHPSQGRAGAGDYSVNADRNSHSRSSSATYSRGLQSGQPSSSQLQTNINTSSWLPSAPTSGAASSSGSNKTAHPSTSSNTSASYMIGPTSTFYDPETIAQQQIDSHAQYQQWVSTYGGQQQQVQPQQRRVVPNFQQSQGQIYHHEPPAQLQNQYNFVQGQYTPPTSISHYAESETGTATGTGGRPTTSSYHHQSQQADSMYTEYYPNTSANTSNVNTGTANTPDPMTSHTLSYNTTPDPAYQQQHLQHQQPQLHHQSSQSQLHIQSHTQNQTHHHSYPSTQTTSPYTSELLSVSSHPNSYSTHSSSLSPASNSWTDEVYPSNPSSNTRASSTTVATPQPTVPPVSQDRSIITSNKSTKTNVTPPQRNPRLQSQQAHTQPRATPQTSSISTNLTKTSAKRKRAKKTHDPLTQQRLYTFPMGESDSESEEEDSPVYSGGGMTMGGGISVGMAGFGVASGAGRGGRLPGACTHCKKLKMKCDFPKTENTCKRCKTGGHVCIVEGRKPRTMPNKREYLLAQIRQKDAIIESLLKQLHNPYIATPMSIASYRMATSPSDQNNRNILAWLDRLKSSVQSSVQTAGGKGGPSAFKDLRGFNAVDDEDSDAETESQAQRYGLVPPPEGDEAAGDEEGTVQDDDKLSSLPDSHVPLGLIANLSLSNNKAKHGKKEQKDAGTSEDNLDDDDVGVANETYFMPGPATDLGIRATLIEQHSPPEILVHGLVAPEDVDKLFEIFYNRVNPFISLLDPVLHTPASTFARCPFLFTVICAISSRYYTEKSEIYPIAMHFAKHSAANALIDGWKSVELCQAYILMSIYAVPARRWEEDRSWLYTGLAIRIATDLNLHQVSTTKPQTEKQEREILNRTRVWMICFNLDRSTATQFGKPSTIKEDYIMRNAENWYRKSKYSHPYDIHLCAYSALLRIVARFHDEIFSDPSAPTGLNKQVDFRSVTMNHDARLTRYHDEWSKRFAEGSDPDDSSCAFRCSLLPFLVGYSRLVMFSFGFQQAFQRGIEPGDHVYFSKCLDAAKSVIRNMIEGLAPSGYMRFAPDGHFIFASFASAFLLKLLRPEFANLLKKEQENEIFDLIGRLIQTLSSPEIAIDDRHTPKLYARFLAGLLSRHRRDGATVGRLHPPPPPNTNSPTSLEYPNNIAPSSTSAFSISQPQGSGSQGYNQNTYNPGSGNQDMTPIYREEATFSAGTGQILFGTDMEITPFGSNGVSEEETLATMYALKNPAWWQNMMMPGFSWPEPLSPSSNGTSTSTPPSYHHQNTAGFHPGPGYHTTQVALH
ncbi:fungal-specific transcription factor domain-containing protein [Collybia nuda]|uniref:Fungal-specific transcription factor domain-containing protein n=1 Tax=Collybia nuda TaxID=64659 RepID=A0A9P5YGS2_9AGAR|nr:fungal-specific transcription factor domain-containing protein [Collybia nuda]